MAKPKFETQAEPIPAGSDIPWNKWPGRTNAARELGVSPSRFRELLQEGALKEYKAPDDSRRYNPEQLEELSETLAGEETAERRETMSLGGIAIEGTKSAIDITRQAHGHLERCLTLLCTVVEKNAATQQQSNDALLRALDFSLKRQEMLEATHLEAVKAQEDSRTARIEAEAASELALLQEARRQALMAAVTPHLGPLISNVSERVQGKISSAFGGKPTASAPPEADASSVPLAAQATASRAAAALGLLESLGHEKLTLVQASGLLDETELSLLAAAIGDLEKCACSEETQSQKPPAEPEQSQSHPSQAPAPRS